ncbi:HAD family hydrolase [Halalkalibacterium ligniniphilum]|uniref:HAD family hydrolase n=1 Tax=Halalkalibacterium ligniniphilum TaxID=1134413 RepID=UPI0003488DAB|nr:HAD family hydrolase [Halalkalibacterium ligniniphilum]
MKGIIFDFDGLILDTETPWYDAYKHVYKAHGHELPLPIYAKTIGTTLDAFHPFRYLEEISGRKLNDHELTKQITQHHASSMEKMDLRPGVRKYLQDAKSEGLKVGLASSSERKWIDRWLSKYQLHSFFDTIWTSDEVMNVKPDPELYEKAQHALGLNKEDVVVFEDSLNGLIAAKRAGLTCVIVPNPVTAHLPFEEHDYQLSSMEEIPLINLLQKLKKKL